MGNDLPALRDSTSLVAPVGAQGPAIARRSAPFRQLARTARSAAELVMVAADAVAERLLELTGSSRP